MMRSLKDFTNNGFQSYDETVRRSKAFYNPGKSSSTNFPSIIVVLGGT